METIKYYAKNVYGKELLYIFEPRHKAIIHTLTGKITINKNEIDALGELGIKFERVLAPLND